jgi:hypothetical protein
MSHMTESAIRRSTTISPMILSERLITLARHADFAGDTITAEQLMQLAIAGVRRVTAADGLPARLAVAASSPKRMHFRHRAGDRDGMHKPVVDAATPN